MIADRGLTMARFGGHRRSIRLPGYDYSAVGAYFVTIVTQGRAHLFGSVVDGEMRLNGAGGVVEDCWHALPRRYPRIILDEFVVMPNHVHGIVVIGEPGLIHEGAHEGRPYRRPDGCGHPPASALGDVVGGFKSTSTVVYGSGVRAFGWRRFRRRLWQRNYYERIIRDADSMNRVRSYIRDNPARWVG